MNPRPSLPATDKIVVLVDDEVAYLELLTQLLAGLLSCPVRGFTSPGEALRELPRLNVGLLLTDYRMPEMDGFKFIAEVQKIDPSIPVLMVTGQAAILSDEECRRLPSLRSVVAKPFKWRALTDEITKHWAGVPPRQLSDSAAPAGNL
jgi:CheY-like chemotaxis protein